MIWQERQYTDLVWGSLGDSLEDLGSPGKLWEVFGKLLGIENARRGAITCRSFRS